MVFAFQSLDRKSNIWYLVYLIIILIIINKSSKIQTGTRWPFECLFHIIRAIIFFVVAVIYSAFLKTTKKKPGDDAILSHTWYLVTFLEMPSLLRDNLSASRLGDIGYYTPVAPVVSYGCHAIVIGTDEGPKNHVFPMLHTPDFGSD